MDCRATLAMTQEPLKIAIARRLLSRRGNPEIFPHFVRPRLELIQTFYLSAYKCFISV
jgi:hypothetical protein